MVQTKRWAALIALAGSGTLFQGGCVADQVIETILAAFQIVDIWV
jgi:hypothetical protein